MKMDDNTKASLKIIKNKDSVFINIKIALSILDIGIRINNMDMGHY